MKKLCICLVIASSSLQSMEKEPTASATPQIFDAVLKQFDHAQGEKSYAELLLGGIKVADKKIKAGREKLKEQDGDIKKICTKLQKKNKRLRKSLKSTNALLKSRTSKTFKKTKTTLMTRKQEIVSQLTIHRKIIVEGQILLRRSNDLKIRTEKVLADSQTIIDQDRLV